MEVASKRKGKISRNGVVVAGSVWENRMRFDDVKGGINVYSEKKETPQVENDEKISTIISGEKTNQVQVYKKLDMGSKCNNLGVGGIVMNGKRKTWKSESNLEGNSNQIVKKTSELSNFCVDNAMKKNPMNKNKKCSSSVGNQLRKVKSEANKEGNEKNCELRKVKSVSLDGNLRNSLHLSVRRTKLLLCAGSGEGSDHESLSASSKELEEEKCKNFEENKVVVDADVLDDESKKNLEENEDGNERNIGLKKVKSMHLSGDLRDSLQIVKEKPEKCKENFEENKVVVDDAFDESKRDLEGSIEENCKEFGVCEEKVITTSNVKSPLKQELNLENEEEDQENIDEEIEKESVVDVKEINVEEQIIKPKKIVIVENNKVHISNNIKKTVPISPIIKKKSLPISGQSRIHHHHHPSPTRTKPVPTSDEFQTNIPRQHSNLQSLVDLIMWRDASKSALIFGIGTFVIISSSYTKDLNISFISVISYLGLVYLVAIFLFRSLRGANDIGESSEYVLGEEEAVWVLKLILPYINECLLKIRALFSGDPATTMKMAVLLFILARCGSSITIWKMSKLGFFGVFTVPKVCSSYSTQLTACGTFWIRRFRDAWVSCTHKKAVAFAIFTLIWNLSSFFARIWADALRSNLFKLDWIHMMTKLRPFVHTFLKEASSLFEMYIYTMGERPYALEMANFLDPRGIYFHSRVIAQSDSTRRHQKGLDVVLGQESAVLILDDTEVVWGKHRENLILMDKYHFFTSSCRQFGLKCKSLSERRSDENEADGALASVLKVLQRIHGLFFDPERGDNIIERDVRQVLKTVRKEILKGCKIVFTGVIPIQCQPENHHYWKLAEQLGATFSTEVNESLTHVVSVNDETEKSRQAVREEEKFLVHPRWIEAANYLWRKPPEENFPVSS